MTVIEYCTKEVSRQGHNTLKLDGIERVGWMLDAWSYALHQGDLSRPQLVSTIENLGKLVERHKNINGFRQVPVYVGGRPCLRPEFIELALQDLCANTTLSPIEWYKEFELIHPFVDGNGRTGKILLNWLNGTLLNPIFPPSDLFGTPILNP